MKRKVQISKDPVRLRAAIEAGISMRAIAERDGVTHSTVSQRAKRYGIPALDLRRARHCVLFPELREFLDGSLVGGGSLLSHHPERKTAFYTQASTKRAYLEWIREQLRGLGVEPEGEIVPMVTKRQRRKEHECWRYSSRSYYELRAILDRWYGKGAKDIPKDFELTPKAALLWYLRSGYFSFGSLDVWKKHPRIYFSVARYSHAGIQCLFREFQRIGCHPSLGRSGCKIILPFADIKRFLEYIGPCPGPCPKELEMVFGHKWHIATGR